MGIHGLLPQLKSIMVPIHVQDLKGQTVAVDTYSWLHKGALCCSLNLCKGIPTSRHIDYCMHRVNLLRHYGVKPILVFDGGFLPMKIDQETSAQDSRLNLLKLSVGRARKENLERAMEHEAAGNSAAAFECYQKAVDISPSVALGLIKVLKQEKVDYIIAPYEADAQMTFLCMNKHVDAVITEDSDLIPFGCSRIIFKMDKFGLGVQFQSSMLGQNKELDLTGFTKQMLLEMCILSGCDYLQSLPGMGLKRAHALVQKFKSYEKVIKHLIYSAISVPPLYEENFRKAIWAFQHQRVYDPIKKEIVHLSDIAPDIGEDLDFLGPWLPPNVVKGIAEGDLDPFTKLPFQAEATCTELMLDKSYSVKESKFASGKKRLDLPVQKNVLTNYFCLASLEAKRKFRAPKIMPRCMVKMESSSPDSTNQESDSPGSAREVTPSINNQHSFMLSKDVGDDLSSQDSLISQQKLSLDTKLTPKCMMTVESSSPSSKSHESGSPGSATDAPLNHQQCSLLLSRDFVGDHPSKDSLYQMEDTFSNESDKPAELLSQGNTASSPDSCFLLELEDEPSRPFLTSHKEQGCRSIVDAIGQGSSVLDGDKRNMKLLVRKVIKRSPYFLNKSLDENDNGSQNEEPFVNNETDEVSGDCPAASTRNGYQKGAAKKRKRLHAYAMQNESQQVKKLHTTSVKEVDHINLNDKCTNGKVEGNFGCDVSHLKNYSGIAEKSMEKFASLISSFRYTSSGSRASGLRPPLKDVQNTCHRPPLKDVRTTCPVRSNVGPIDFSKYAYKPKNKSV